MYDAGFYFWKEQEIVSFSKMSESALVSTQPGVPRARSQKVKQPVYEADHSPPCGAEVIPVRPAFTFITCTCVYLGHSSGMWCSVVCLDRFL
jgi:hypothetical protein